MRIDSTSDPLTVQERRIPVDVYKNDEVTFPAVATCVASRVSVGIGSGDSSALADGVGSGVADVVIEGDSGVSDASLPELKKV